MVIGYDRITVLGYGICYGRIMVINDYGIFTVIVYGRIPVWITIVTVGLWYISLSLNSFLKIFEMRQNGLIFCTRGFSGTGNSVLKSFFITCPLRPVLDILNKMEKNSKKIHLFVLMDKPWFKSTEQMGKSAHQAANQ